MKRIISIILSVFMIIALMPINNVFAEDNGVDLTTYTSRVPRALVYAIHKAEELTQASGYEAIAQGYKSELESDLSSARSLANDFERGYYRGYGYNYNRGYDYYSNGYYYVNGVAYTEREFYNRFGYYPDRDYYNYYRDYDYYSNGYYYVNGVAYTEREFYNRFGYYPDRDYYNYYRDYDYYSNGYYYVNGVPYTEREFYNRFGYYPDRYGYNDYYYGRYYNSGIRRIVEDLIYSIRKAGEDAVPGTKAWEFRAISMPSVSEYDGYYYGDYYYDGYYDEHSYRVDVENLKDLISDAEKLAESRKDKAWKAVKQDLEDAIDYARAAIKRGDRLSNASDKLEKAIESAKKATGELYIRRSYMKGLNPNKFSPEGTLTRAEVAQIIANLSKQSGNDVTYQRPDFKDVQPGSWYKEAVDLAYSTGLLKGFPDNTFKPDEPITIEQLIVIAARLGGYTPSVGNVFGIVDHKWSVGYIQTAYNQGWIDARGFNPSAAISRGQTAHIFNNALGYGPDKDFIKTHANSLLRFADVLPTYEYYNDIIIATNTILYERKDNKRFWRSIKMENGNWSDRDFSDGQYVMPIK